MAQDRNNIQVLLYEGNGISRPTFLRSDEKGEQLTVINEDGHEIRNYNIYKVTRFAVDLTTKINGKEFVLKNYAVIKM